MVEKELSGTVQGVLVRPSHHGGLGIVVLGGSSGRVDVSRARLFADHGAMALALRWFGGDNQAASICEIPLETFDAATERLLDSGCQHIAYIGTSRGAEAALLTACHDLRIGAVIAISPSSVVWANADPRPSGEVWSQRSSFTRRGEALPFLPFDETVLFTMSRTPPVSYLDLHLATLLSKRNLAEAAAIPIERSKAEVILVAGGDDRLWPSERFARSLADRLKANGRSASVLVNGNAGHRILLPGELTSRSVLNAHGGNDLADQALGAEAWRRICEVLGFNAYQVLGRD